MAKEKYYPIMRFEMSNLISRLNRMEKEIAIIRTSLLQIKKREEASL